jgi:putative transposase
MFHQLFYHVVWTTRERRPTITATLARVLDRVLRSIAHQERAEILELGMVSTHVHLLVRAHTMTVIPRLLQRLKGASSALACKELGLPWEKQLRWAHGYAIQTVSPRMVETVRGYVHLQARRHPSEAISGWEPAHGIPLDPGTEPLIEESLGCWENGAL